MSRVGGFTGEVMAVLVSRGKDLPRLPELLAALRSGVPRLASVMLIVKTDRGNAVLTGAEYCLWGKDHISSRLNGFSFAISARSFFQVNSLQTGALYVAAADMARLSGQELVIEAYSGLGSSSFFIARRVRRLIGIELSPGAVADAQSNARANGFANVSFIAGDAGLQLPLLASQGFKPDCLFADPPRAGLSPQALSGIIQLSPQTIIYISCNPASLARDTALLAARYLPVEFQPVDMFPMTSHVECIAKFSRLPS
jgi:23S rRNA (uracil1939-C5)-methyltransferase